MIQRLSASMAKLAHVRLILFAVAACAVVAGTTTEAAGQTVVTIALQGGYGAGDGYQAGAGLMGGAEVVVLDKVPVLFGARVGGHLGATVTVLDSLQAEPDMVYGAGDIGVRVLATPVVVTALTSVGGVWTNTRYEKGSFLPAGETKAKVAVAPGLLVGREFAGGGFIGVEAKYWVVKEWENAFAIYLTLGLRM